MPGARLDYHDEIVRDCSWHPTQNTIVTTSFDGSVVQCVLSVGACSARVLLPQLSVCSPQARPLQPSLVLQGLCAGAGLYGLTACKPEPQRMLFATCSCEATCCRHAGGRRSRLSTRTQLRSAAGAAGDARSTRVQQRVQQWRICSVSACCVLLFCMLPCWAPPLWRLTLSWHQLE